jgi:hypothetical protein
MSGNPGVAELRERLTRARWQLNELGGGPWIIYGFNGAATFCVMGKTRLAAWQKACDEARRMGLLSPLGRG